MRHIPAGHHYLCDVSTGFSSAHTIKDATAARWKIINKILLWDVNKRLYGLGLKLQPVKSEQRVNDVGGKKKYFL